jgi:hypothetical protein
MSQRPIGVTIRAALMLHGPLQLVTAYGLFTLPTTSARKMAAPLEILGAPVLELALSANRPVAMIAVHLSDVQPDDKAIRVTYGLLNLTHRDGHADPAPLEPEVRYRVRVQLNAIAQAFPRGHRLRLALSTSYFPLAWPPPEPVHLRIHTGASRLLLPVRPHRDEPIAFEAAEATPAGHQELLHEGQHTWRVIRDLASDTSTLEVINDNGSLRLVDIDTTVARSAREWYSYQGDDFTSPRGETLWTPGLQRGAWSIRTVTRTVLRGTPTEFHLTAELDAYEGGTRVFSENWDRRVHRRLV